MLRMKTNKIYVGALTNGPDAVVSGSALSLCSWDTMASAHQIVLLSASSAVTSTSTNTGTDCVSSRLSAVLAEQIFSTYSKYRNKHYTVAVPECLLDAGVWRDALGPLLQKWPIHLGLSLPSDTTALLFWRDLHHSMGFPPALSVFLFANSASANILPWKHELVSCMLVSIDLLELEHSGLRSSIDIEKTGAAAGVVNDAFSHALKAFCSQKRPLIILTPVTPGVVGADVVLPQHLATMKSLVKSFQLQNLAPITIRDPLQPLRDNLELGIYEVFEKDAAKYEAYEGAIAQAIHDKKSARDGAPLKVLVIGPGRGPLLEHCVNHLGASDELVAVEKNRRCAALLLEKNASRWHNRVELVYCDIRQYNGPHKGFDIILSELLGSFGCNELSPDILATVSPSIASSDTIMIPQLYTSYVVPIYSPILSQMVATTNQWERPYVVDEHEYVQLAPVAPMLRFSHPGENQLEQCASTTLTTTLSHPVQGLLGYFTSTLYGLYQIGNIRGTDGYCSSWNPIFFPLKDGGVSNRGKLEIQVVRKKNVNGVYYEWAVDGNVHNRNGYCYVVEY